MSRRVATLSLTAVLLIVLICLAWLVPVPFAVMSPGPTENTLGEVDGKPIIQIDGHKTYKTNGQLDLTTVSVTGPQERVDLISVVAGWLDPRVAVVPYDYLYPGDPTPEQVEQQNAEAMETSQQTAIAAALRHVNQEVTPVVQVSAVVEGTPAVGRLKAGDTIVAVDGTKVETAGDVVELVRQHQPGDRVVFTVRRKGKELDVPITTTRAPDDKRRAFVGITPFDGFEFPFDVEVTLGQDIGGPSAGVIFALAIVDKLTAGSLTGGKHIAGTGAIEPDGTVRPIGGIQQKLAGAKRSGATTFLVPEENCPAAAAAEVDGLRLVRIKNLAGAVRALERLRDNPKASVPTCER